MKGEILSIVPRPGPTPAESKLTARVALGDGSRHEISYWPELLEQWGPDALRAWILQQAVEASSGGAEPAHETHGRALVGAGEAAPVCRKGEIGCTDEHGEPPPDVESAP